MPRGTVHDDGGDQLHGRGIGTIYVTHYDKGGTQPVDYDIYLPFRNQNPRVEIEDVVAFDVKTVRCKQLGGNIRIAFNIDSDRVKPEADKTHPSRAARTALENVDR